VACRRTTGTFIQGQSRVPARTYARYQYTALRLLEITKLTITGTSEQSLAHESQPDRCGERRPSDPQFARFSTPELRIIPVPTIPATKNPVLGKLYLRRAETSCAASA